nr:reverse transcriptase domain-containing protein [Tanacetum cinerariifolium]
MIVLEAMTIHFEVATIWVNPLGGSIRSSFAPTARPTRCFRADYGFVSTLDDAIRRDPEREIGYGITNTSDEILMVMLGEPTTNDIELGRRMMNFAITVRDKYDHAQTARLIKTKARPSRQAWKIEPKRTTKSTPATTNTTTTIVTDAQLKALLTKALLMHWQHVMLTAARDADRSRNDEDSYDSGMGARRQAPLALGSFDVVMDWLAKCQAVIVYAKKIICIPWGNETLIVHGDGSDQGNKTRLNIISCTKTQKYMLKGCHVFLAHVTSKETKDNSKKRLEDVLIV